MAKKQKKSKLRSSRITSGSFSSSSAPEEFTPDYSNTKKDLTRIGILAGASFVLLIILSFFIK